MPPALAGGVFTQDGGYADSAYKILARWALNSPDALERLEALGLLVLEERLNAQLEMEIDAHNSESARRAFEQGWTVYEFYEAVGIDTELRV